ncbi:MAG: isoleucine--tRNA ligase, partial [Dehalococcoidales bacterium]|nr:isoleucine--tRNA ligase [Dehalococcoidales bacterium]
AEFNELCRQSVFRYLKDWEALTERIGFWIDQDNAYVTMKNEYIESVWWAIKQMWDKGLVYQGYRVTPHCPRCGTSLSSHEVALGYQDDVKDPSVYIKFKVVKSLYSQPGFLDRLRQHYGDREADFAGRLLELAGEKDVYLLAWTTTPWTLPGNTALAVASDAEYVIVEAGGEYLILASARREQAGLRDAPVVDRITGRDLVDLRYEPLFNPRKFDIPVTRMSNAGDEVPRPASLWEEDILYPVIVTDFVSMEDGTGIVHMAPAYGEVDYEAGKEKGLDFVHTVDLQGKVIGTYPFAGKFVKDADPLVLMDLAERGLLYRSETIRHTYPFCWRCGTPLLYYAKETWYIRTTAVKESLIAGNEQISWYPEHIKYGRFGDWLNNNVDWAFSRERYWGTPLPVWQCESCGGYECIGGLEELKGKPGGDKSLKIAESAAILLGKGLDLHRPFVDEVTFTCPKCGGKMKRVPEVIDCWFDSGAMPVAQHHYPFENETLLSDGRFPADYICEAVDQTRGWFYSLHAISTLLFGHPCYRNVICLGLVLDARGEKMSKTRGNVVEPWAVIDKYGADALRWYFFTAVQAGNVYRFAEDMVKEVTRRFLLTLWNVYSFFVTYANIDRFTPGAEEAASNPPELDRWIISELNQLISDVDLALDNYNPTDAGRKIENFVDVLSNWYVRRSRRRFWKSENDADKLAAYNTLYRCLVTLSELLAPITPFLAEELYQNLVRSVSPEAPLSVHLTDFPVAEDGLVDRQLMDDMQFAMKVSSLGRAARSKAGIKVRQPVATNYVGASAEWQKKALERIKPLVLEELNAKELKWDSVEKVMALDGNGYAVVSEAANVSAISTDLSDELKAEGVAREIVHRLQTMRRSAGFDIADHITTYYRGNDYIRRVLEDFADYIKQETLSRELVDGVPQGVFTENYKLDGNEVALGVKRLD